MTIVGIAEDTASGSVDSSALRIVFAGVPSPVAVITTGSRPDRYGATIGSLISLSLDPPLLAFAAKRGSNLLAHLPIGACFGVNVLAADQERVAKDFAAGGRDRFERTLWCHDNGVPRIDGCAGWLVSEVAARHVAGDHEIIVGHVVVAELAHRPALLFAENGFHPFVAAPAAR